MEKKTFRQLVAELMMDVEKYGDLIVTDYKILADYNEDMGFDPYMGCYTEDC